MMENIEIIKVEPKDVGQLQLISKLTFTETYAADIAKDDLDHYLEEALATNQLIQELEHKHSHFFFAQLGTEVIGYLKVNFKGAQTAIEDDKSLEIERIYILKAYQGKRIGHILFNKAVQLAKESNLDFIWLGVWEQNPKAIHFYHSKGLVTFDQKTFKLGSAIQTDLMMKLQLQ